jgi:hypothetical protein
MRMNRKWWLLGAALPLFSACFYELAPLADMKGARLATEVAIPLFNDEMGIKDFYDQFSKTGFIRQDGTQPITFVYTSRDSIEQRQFVNIPPVFLNFNVEADAAIATAFNTLGSFSQTFSGVSNVDVAGNEQFKKLDIATGTLTVSVSCDFKHNTKIVMEYPSITKNGQSLIDSFELNYTGNSPVVINRSINLAGYRVDMTDGGTSFNKLPYNVSLSVVKVTGNPNMLAGERFAMTQYMVVPRYKFLEGYMGKFTILRTNEEISIDLFANQVGGRLFLNDPRLRIRILNAFGLPITCKISNFYARGYDDVPVPISIDLFKDTFSLPYAIAPGDLGQGEYTIDKNNSNIDVVLNSAPKSIHFVLDIQANYNDIPTNNFMFDSSSLKSFSDIEIPLDMIIDNYTVKHQDDFKFPKFANTELEDVTITTEATSTMPIGTTIQMYFCKKRIINGVDSFDIVDSMFVEGLKLDPADVDGNGNVIPIPRSVRSNAYMTRERYKRVQDEGCDFYYITFRANSAKDANGNKPYVRIYNTQKVTVKAGLLGNAKYQQGGGKQ